MHIDMPAPRGLLGALSIQLSDENGQTLVEYALLIALVSIALIGTLQAFGGGVNGLYGVIQAVVDSLSGS